MSPDGEGQGKRAKEPRKKGFGRGMMLGGFLLVVGLVLGGIGVIALERERPGILTRSGPGPAATPKPVTVEKERTPESCVAALDTQATSIRRLAEARALLMQGDVASASGESSKAKLAYAEVDQILRDVEIETAKEPLTSAIADCQAKAGVTGTPIPPLTPTPPLTTPIPPPSPTTASPFPTG